MWWYSSTRARLGLALLASSLVSVGFWVAGAISNHSTQLGYLLWNLGLAWIPLFFALWLERILRVKLWSSWIALVVTALWLMFLPNSFYVLSDFVHLTEFQRADIVFDTAMFGSFALNGLVLGYVSLFLVHSELRKRMAPRQAGGLVTAVLLISSFAIYVGRDLHWNTWDVILSPASLLFDVSDRLINAGAHPQLLSTTAAFFILLSSLYVVIYYMIYCMARSLRQQKT